MTIFKKINIIVSVINSVMFLIPVLIFVYFILSSSEDSDLIWFLLLYVLAYIWFAIPSIISLIVYFKGKYENKTFNILMIILNIIALFWLFPMFKAYLV